MAVIRRTFELFSNVPDGTIINPISLRTIAASDAGRLFRGDTCVLRVHLRSYPATLVDADTFDVFPVNENTILTFGVKDPADLAGDYLASADNTKINLPGDWPDALRSAGKLSIRLSLTDPRLATYLSTSTEKTIRAELQAQDPGEEPTTLFQYDSYIYADVNRGDEAAPNDQNPLFAPIPYVDAAITQAIKPTGGSVKIENGQLKVWNPTQAKWHAIWVDGVEGEEHFVHGPPEE